MNAQKWISFSLVSLTFAVVAWGWVARSTFCLDSKLVEKIDMVTEGGRESIAACSVSKNGVFSESLFELKTDLETRFHRLERSLDFMGFRLQPLRLSVVESVDPLVRVHPSHLILSKSVLQSKNVLEKSVLLSLLLQQRADPSQALTVDETLWADVFGDVFLAFEKGGFQIQDPLLNQSFAWSDRRSDWPFTLKTKESYCQDAGRSFLHLGDCLQGHLTNEQVLSSLRPFLGLSLYTSLEKLKPGERMAWFRDVWSNWSKRQIQRRFYGSSLASEDRQEMVDAARLIQSWMENFRAWGLTDSNWATVTAEMQKEIEARGFRSDAGVLKSELVILLSTTESEDVLQGLREATLLDSKQNVLVVKNNDAWLLPDLRPFPKSWLGEYRVQQALMIQCSIPSMDRLRELASRVQKLTLIRVCAPQKTVAWNKLLSNGLEDFLKANPKVPFIRFHLPSLKAALLKKNLNPIPMIELGDWSGPFFKEIGWEEPQWDKDLQAFRSRSVIEAIESFRMNAPEEPSSAL